MKVRLKCKECGYEFETNLRVNPLGSMKPGCKNPGAGIKIDKDSLDKILEQAKGASREELEKLGIYIEPGEWENAQERLALRKFLLENLKINKEKHQQRGEKYVVATEPWSAGDSFRDVDLTSSEVKSMGVDDLRMIPGVTMQKKVYGITKGRDTEELKGVRFLVIIDGSGSMIAGGGNSIVGGKIGKALLIGKEIYEITKRLGFEYVLVLFSDRGVRVDKKRMKEFWADASERVGYGIWNGGTRLTTGLDEFTEKEYKDANVVVISDMDIADFGDCKDRITQLAKLTNTFKIILVEEGEIDIEERQAKTRDLFPADINLKIMIVPVKGQGS